MAVVQAAANKMGIGQIAHADAGGYYYVDFLGVRFYSGAGSANAVITAPTGSMYINTTTGELEINTDAGTTWAHVGAQS